MSVREIRHDRPGGRFSKSRGLSASVSFLSSPPLPRSFIYAIFRAVFDSRSLLLNRTETLATQANNEQTLFTSNHLNQHHLRNLSLTSIIQRLQLFNSFNGDAFYPLSVWPQDFKLIFWKKPISDTFTFKLFLFLVGNGCSPNLISHWILTSQHWTSDKKAEKRARQLDFLLNNMDKKSYI